MGIADDDVVALAAGSATVARLDRVRQLCMIALDESWIVGRGRLFAKRWSDLPPAKRRRQIGVVGLVAVFTHVALLSTSSGFHAWVVYILPTVAGLVAAIAIVTGRSGEPKAQ